MYWYPTLVFDTTKFLLIFLNYITKIISVTASNKEMQCDFFKISF